MPTSLFTKSIDEITPDDVAALIGEPESGDLEFKGMLSNEDGTPDRWITEGDGIGRHARNSILKAAVAFANAQGGHLIIGVGESDERPPRAEHIIPIDRCCDLAERVRDQLRDCIEPKLATALVRGVVTDGLHRGVVVLRIPGSIHAPHRSRGDLECYLRRNDRSEKMTMREIQDLTRLRDRGAILLDQKFATAAQGFRNVLWRDPHTRAFGVRVTGFPIEPLELGRVSGRRGLVPIWSSFQLKPGKAHYELPVPVTVGAPTPIFRGVRVQGQFDDRSASLSIYSDGAVDARFFTVPHTTEHEDFLRGGEILNVAANTLLNIDIARRFSGSSALEYGIEVEVVATLDSLALRQFASEMAPVQIANVNPIMIPRLGLNAFEQIPDILSSVCQDLFDATGNDAVAPTFEAVLAARPA